MSIPIVLDTNVIVAAQLRGGTVVRSIFRAAFVGHFQPLLGAALFAEYQDVCGRESLFADSVLSKSERTQLLDAVFRVSRWVEVFYLWRPNLHDEADNHLVELAMAGGAAAIVTRNVRDFTRGELRFPSFKILTPQQCLEEFPCPL